jgi:hypothetical protein
MAQRRFSGSKGVQVTSLKFSSKEVVKIGLAHIGG